MVMLTSFTQHNYIYKLFNISVLFNKFLLILGFKIHLGAFDQWTALDTRVNNHSDVIWDPFDHI